MQKILSYILLFSFLFLNNSIVQAKVYDSQSILVKNVILTKNKLRKNKSLNKYISQIDKFIKSIENKKGALEKLERKIITLKSKIYKMPSSSKKTKIVAIVDYLEAKIKLSLFNLKDDLLSQFENNDISESDRKIVEDKLVKLQLNLLEKGVKSIEDLTKKFEELSNYEEKGDFKIDLDINQEQIGQIKTNFKFNNYTVKASNFDSQIKGKIEAIIDAIPAGGDAIKLELSSMIDFIQKDSNIYLLLENLNIKEENINKMKEYIDILEKMAKENKYVKFEDGNNKQGLKILKSLTPNNIIKDGRNILSKPMFTTYKKDGDRFYLIPTKYACDKMKELGNRFDPFNGKDCTENQYNNMLRDLAEVGKIYIEIGTNTKISFEGLKIHDMEKLDGYIIFSNEEIKEISFIAIPNQKKYPNEGASISYIKNNKIDFDFYADKGSINFNLESKLDKSNRFTFINYKGKSDDFESFLTLGNHKIKGGCEYKDYSWKKISTEITGKTNYLNKLESIDISYYGKGKKDGVIEGNFSYKSENFILNSHYTSEGVISDIKLSGDWNSSDKILTAIDSDISVKTKKRIYDYSTYKYSYTGSFSEVFKSEIELKDKNIIGNTIIKNKDGKEIVNIRHNGKFEKNYLEFNNAFSLNSEEFDFIKSNSGALSDTLGGNLNIKTDLRNNKDNINIYFDLDVDESNVIKFEIDNKSKIKYKDVKIKTPTNTIPSSEVFGDDK